MIITNKHKYCLNTLSLLAKILKCVPIILLKNSMVVLQGNLSMTHV